MKELSIEEKAKAYDKALERARKLQENSNGMILKKWLWNIFPELKESKDNEIMKVIRGWIYTRPASFFDNGISKEEILAWLEKQGEQKLVDSSQTCKMETLMTLDEAIEHCKKKSCDDTSCGKEHKQLTEWLTELKGYRGSVAQEAHKPADKVEPKFKVGDWCIDNEDGTIFQIVKVLDNTYIYKTNEGKEYSCTHYSLENDARFWSIQDAKDGDVLYSPFLKLLWIFKSKDTVYCGCNLNYNDGAFCGEGYIERHTDAIPATKEQRELLLQRMKEAGYEWDTEKKESKLLITNGGDFESESCEQKPACSEEDEKIYQSIMDDTVQENQLDIKQINWLKSIRQRIGG